LPTVTIRASADASAGGLRPAYAGGQVARGGRIGVLGSQDIMETPFLTTSYTQQFIQDQQAAGIGDVLQNDPSVRITRGFGNFQEQYTVRGLPVYSDDMAYNGLYGMLPRQYIAAEFFERVEVLRGANTFLNGAAPGGSGLGGAINLVPKRAPNEPLTQVTFGVESGGQTYVATDLSRRFGPDGSTGIRINAVNRNGDTAVDGSSRRLDMLSVGLDYHGGGLRVSADVGYQDHHLDAATPNVTVGSTLPVPAAPDASHGYAQPWTRSNERDTFGTLRAEYDIAPKLTAWLAAGVRHSNEFNILANPTVIDTAGTTSSYRFDNYRDDSVATGELGLRAGFTTGAIKHTLTASLAAFQLRSKNAYAFSDFSGFAGNLYQPSPAPEPNADFFVGGVLSDPLLTHRVRTNSAAIADVLSMLDDRLLVTIGARYQRIEDLTYDYTTGVQNEPGYDKSAVTPVGGVVYKFSPQFSGFANYIEGLTAGPVAPQTTGGANPVPVTNANEVFPPTRTKQVEVGAKYDGGRIGGAISVFQTRRPQGQLVGDTFTVSDNLRIRGLGVQVYGEPLSGLRTLGGFDLIDTDVDGKTAIGTPKSQINFGVDWDVPGVPGLALNGRAVYTDKQYLDQANTQVVPSWTRLDLGARYLFSVGSRLVTVRARVDNATNHNYWASAAGISGSSYIVLGAPRTFSLSGTVDF
jgi:iron complex outermembrane receptor protein